MSHYELEALLRPCVLESPDDPEDIHRIVTKYVERRFLLDRMESWRTPYQKDTRSMDAPGRRDRPMGFTPRFVCESCSCPWPQIKAKCCLNCKHAYWVHAKEQPLQVQGTQGVW